jgi:serine/threonine protein phosphatase 1
VDLRLPLRPEDTLVFIGDYVDRGPDSRGVIDYLLDLKNLRRCVFLRGNHEAMFMDWLGIGPSGGPPVPMRAWFETHGGEATLRSYGVATTGLLARWRLRSRAALDRIPPHHRAFLEQTRFSYEDDHAYYVHAGFRPDRAPADQEPEDLLSIREGWVDQVHPLDKPVVHGHTPTPFDGGELEPRLLPHRINLDTGCGRHPNGFLSAVRLPDRARFSAGDRRQQAQ